MPHATLLDHGHSYNNNNNNNINNNKIQSRSQEGKRIIIPYRGMGITKGYLSTNLVSR